MSHRKKKNNRVGKKIEFLRHEGVPEKQAVGEAEGMADEGRLTKSGGYIRSKRKKKRSSRRSA